MYLDVGLGPCEFRVRLVEVLLQGLNLLRVDLALILGRIAVELALLSALPGQ
jgi:hypothetical protein